MLSARRAVGSELALVQEVTEAAYAEYGAVLDAPPLPVTEAYGPRIAAGEVWLVFRDGEMMGLMVLETEPDHLMVFSLAVLPVAQGMGVRTVDAGVCGRSGRETGESRRCGSTPMG